MQIICPLLLATSWSLTDSDWLNPQSMSFNILYKSLFLIHQVLVWFSSPVKSLLGGWELFQAVWKVKRCLLEGAKGWSRNCLCAATSILSAFCRIRLFLFLTYWFLKNFLLLLFVILPPILDLLTFISLWKVLVSGDVALAQAVFNTMWSDRNLFLHLPSSGGFSSHEMESTMAPIS